MYKKYKKFPAKFWVNINIKSINDCWDWKGKISKNGYGYHRTAYELINGEIPEEKIILHLCNNRKCCNPTHLILGTQKENLQQMMKENRGNKTSKLNKEQVIQIRELRKIEGITLKKLSQRFNISFSQIGNIIHERCWKNI